MNTATRMFLVTLSVQEEVWEEDELEPITLVDKKFITEVEIEIAIPADEVNPERLHSAILAECSQNKDLIIYLRQSRRLKGQSSIFDTWAQMEVGRQPIPPQAKEFLDSDRCPNR